MNKITELGISILLAVDLEGMFLFEDLILKNSNFKADKNGNILDEYIDSLKIAIMEALRFAIGQNSDTAPKLRRALKNLLDYGTEETSTVIIKFLESQESSPPIILSGIKNVS